MLSVVNLNDPMKASRFIFHTFRRATRSAYSNRNLSINLNLKSTNILTKPQSGPSVNLIEQRRMSSGPTYTVDYLTDKIKKELQAEHVDMEDLSNCGCGMKFDAVIVSPQFEGKPILQRQRLVNKTLEEEMKHIHAFTMRTLTPSQWKESLARDGQNKV